MPPRLSLKWEILLTILFAFGYEHVARLHDWWRFSILLTWMADQFYELFLRLGRLIAHLSAFLNYIDMVEIMKTADSLITPLFKICFSPFAMIYEYARVAYDEVPLLFDS